MVKSTGNSSPQQDPLPTTYHDRQLAVVVAAIAVGLLVRDVPLDLLPGDPGEFQFAAWRFGLAHPTGYPLYLLIGGSWQHLLALAGLSPAGALNLLSALFTGIACGLFFWLLAQWLPGPPYLRRLSAGLAAAFLLANPTVRSQAVIAEVYALQLLLLVAILLAAQRLLAARAQANSTASQTGARFPWQLVLLCSAHRPGPDPPCDDNLVVAAAAALLMAERPQLVAASVRLDLGAAGIGAAVLALSLHSSAQRPSGYALVPPTAGQRCAPAVRQRSGRFRSLYHGPIDLGRLP